MRNGIPIFLGYFPVAFSFGITAVGMGLSVSDASIMSFTNLTSTGQFAGLGIIVGGASLAEMAITQLVINMRYFLMSVSLSQKYGAQTKMLARLAAAFFVTDEIFALAASRKGVLTASYLSGIGIAAYMGWTSGTVLGAIAGNVLPTAVTNALGISLYGMLIALVIPTAKKSLSVVFVVFTAVIISCAFKYIPFINNISYGFAIIISTIAASVFGALLFPVNETDDNEKEGAA